MFIESQRPTTSALVTLVILQLVMLTALYTKTQPHPPEAIPLFGIAPFLAVSLSAALVALIFDAAATKTGRVFSVLAALMALLSYGPQKYFDAQFSLIWPSVIAGQIAAAVIIYYSLRRAQ